MLLKVYSRRWGHEQIIEVEITEKGWNINSPGLLGGECDSKGNPYLFEHLDHDGINYPEELGGYMDYLWRKAKEENMSDEEIQEHLDELGRWISIVEKNSPGGIWKYFK